MRQKFLVSNGEVFKWYPSMEKGYFVNSYDKSSLQKGYKPFQIENVGTIYRKYFKLEEISSLYEIEDSVLFQGKEYSIVHESDENHDKPHSYVQIAVADKEILLENNWMDGIYILEEKYGDYLYCSGKIPVSEVIILRRRKELPIDSGRVSEYVEG